MTPTRILGAVLAAAAAALVLTAPLGLLTIAPVVVLLVLAAGLLFAPRHNGTRRPGYVDPAVFASPPCAPHGVAGRNFETPTEWIVEFELWSIDLISAASIGAIEDAVGRVVRGRRWESEDASDRKAVVYRVQVLASDHDVALRAIERAAAREIVSGLHLRNLSARPGTIHDTRSNIA